MKPAASRLEDRGVDDVGLLDVLAADVDERLLRARREGGDDHALDEHVRALLHELAVLERAGLGFVGVADEVLVDVDLRDERDLLAAREARAAAAAQAGGDQLVGDLGGRHRRQHLAQRLVAAAALVDVDRVQAAARRCRRRGSWVLMRRPRSRAVVRSPPAGRRAAAHRRSGAWVGERGRRRRDRARCARVGALAQVQLLAGQRRHALADLLDERRHLVERDRADVDAVDGRHRRDVAGAQALEAAHVELRVALGLLLDARQQLVGAAQRAGDVRADVDRVAADRACVSSMS